MVNSFDSSGRVPLNGNTHEQDALQAAIAQLYTAFSSYLFRPHMPVCSHCVSRSDLKHLQMVPFHLLTLDELSFYLSKSMTTWGEVEDFKHFLPRLLECLSSDSHEYRYGDYPNVLGQKLKDARWQNWPQREQQAILCYFIALWHSVLSSFPSPHPDLRKTSLFLRCLAHFIENLEPFLLIWQHNPSLSALRHLAQFVLEEAAGIVAGQNIWWDRWEQGIWEPGRGEQMKQWLLSPLACRLLEEAYYSYADEPVGQEFIQAYDWLCSLLL